MLQIKQALSRDAGIPNQTWEVLSRADTWPILDAFDSVSLSAYFVCVSPAEQAEHNGKVREEFRYLTEERPIPNDLSPLLWQSRSQGYASFIQPDNITTLLIDFDENSMQATGRVFYGEDDFYRGSVRFTAKEVDGDWQITQFRLPEYGVVLRHVDGRWKHSSSSNESSAAAPPTSKVETGLAIPRSSSPHDGARPHEKVEKSR